MSLREFQRSMPTPPNVPPVFHQGEVLLKEFRAPIDWFGVDMRQVRALCTGIPRIVPLLMALWFRLDGILYVLKGAGVGVGLNCSSTTTVCYCFQYQGACNIICPKAPRTQIAPCTQNNTYDAQYRNPTYTICGSFGPLEMDHNARPVLTPLNEKLPLILRMGRVPQASKSP